MTSKTKTGDKLVASIRKSKTGAVAQKTSQRTDKDESTESSELAAVRPEPKAASKKPRSAQGTNQERKNSFSHGRRVWPD